MVLAVAGLNVNDLSIMENNSQHVLAGTNDGLYRSEDGGENWDKILNQRIWDIERKPDEQSRVYALLSNTADIRSEVWVSDNNGEDCILEDEGWYSSQDPDRTENGGRMTVTPADPDVIYVILNGQSKPGDNGYIGVFRSDDAGESWSLPAGQVGGPYSNAHPNLATLNNTNTLYQGYYNLGIAASHTNKDEVLIGCLNLWRTRDGGVSFEALGGYQGNVGWIHPDQQEIEINGNDMWVANDGGINYSTDLFSTHESRKNGLQASDFWGFGSAWNEDLVVGGRYHNGNSAYRPSFGEGRFLRLGGAEAATGYVQPGGEAVSFFSDISAEIVPNGLNGAVIDAANINMFPSESFYAAHYSELEFGSNCYGHIFIGRENKIWKSEDNGNTFELLSEFGTDTGAPIQQFEISRINPDVMYAYQRTSFYGAVLWSTVDGGVSWTQKDFPQGASSMRAGVLKVHGQYPNRLYVAFAHNNNDGNKLWMTDDYGDNWTNISDPILDGETIHDLFHHHGTSSDLYVGTNYSIYYFNGSEWMNCNTGLPARFVVNRFQVFYKENKLRVASYGNGIWEMDLINQTIPQAQITVDKLSSNCSRDTFYFDDYSRFQQDGNHSWLWNFEPEPIYVSDKSVRNPKVVFGTSGSYTITLEINNNDGSSTDTQVDMINVEASECQPDPFPGLAASCAGTGGDYVQTANLGFTSESFTLSAWIKPNGIQNDYTGIIFNDGEGTGLNFTTGNQLGFHYEGQGSAAWAWSSGLFVPTDEWSHVAMVVEPNEVVVYLNGEAASRALNLDPTTFTTLKMGSYRGWGSRNYNGLIDEVAIWDRALSLSELRQERHITKLENNDGLIAYYQFNEASGRVLDKIGSSHANLTGLTERQTTDGPYGGGIAHVFEGLSDGSLSEGLDNELALSVVSQNENNMWCISQINHLATEVDVDDVFPPEQYWIINTYGNPQIEGMTFMLNEPIEDFYEDNPNDIVLYQRNENAGDESWTPSVSANSVNIDLTTNIAFETTGLNASQVVLSKPIVSNVNEIDLSSALVYPNPTTGNISVKLEGANIRLHLYNDKGNLLMSRAIKANEMNDVLSKMAAGTYYYLLETDKKMWSGKVVKVD